MVNFTNLALLSIRTMQCSLTQTYDVTKKLRQCTTDPGVHLINSPEKNTSLSTVSCHSNLKADFFRATTVILLKKKFFF